MGVIMAELGAMGEWTSISYGRVPESGEVDWHFLPHSEFDGIGGFAHLVANVEGVEARVPTLRDAHRHPVHRRTMGFLRVVSRLRRRYDPKRLGDCQVKLAGSPGAVAFVVCDEAESRRIVHAASSRSVTVNSLLLHSLARASAPAFAVGNGPMLWGVPVNMRTRGARDYGNIWTLLYVEVNERLGVADVHRVVQDELDKSVHHGSFALTWLMSRMPAQTRKDVVTQMGALPATGVFSNLGSWEIPSGRPWVFCPPPSGGGPVAAGCVTVNGRLGLMIQIHGSLAAVPVATADVLERWKRLAMDPTADSG